MLGFNPLATTIVFAPLLLVFMFGKYFSDWGCVAVIAGYVMLLVGLPFLIALTVD